ncbi:MAG TPA: hypothetical protein VL326_23765 [Kofleriaceae bacterium]|nr:hypothetical protein [Kofleriaceae bacterium]
MWRASGLALVIVAGCGRGFFNPDLGGQCDGDVATGPAPRFVQANFTSSGGVQAQGRTVAFTLAQSAGNAIVVVVMWDASSATVDSLYDDAGNAYMAAVGPTLNGNNWAQTIFLASNIKAVAPGNNVVHAAFSTPAFVRVAIAEYADVDTAQPLDGTASMTGTPGTAVSPGSILTTHASDMLVAATSSSGALSADYPTFMQRTSGPDYVLQDKPADVAQGYTPLAAAGNFDWVAHVIALRGR